MLGCGCRVQTRHRARLPAGLGRVHADREHRKGFRAHLAASALFGLSRMFVSLA